MRIAHVITGLGVGGAEGMLHRLVAARREDVVRVVSLMDVGPVGARLQALGVPVSALGMARGRPEPAALVRLVRLLRRDRPDVVQTWMYHADLLGGLAAGLLRVPVIWGVRHDRLGPDDKALTRATRRLCAVLSRWIPAAIVCNSEASLRTHAEAGYAVGKLVVIPNGFDVSRFRPDPAARAAVRRELGVAEDVALVGLVARYHPHKGHETFVGAAGRILRARPEARFVLCGDGVDGRNEALAGLLAGAGLGRAAHLLGRREDVERILAALDVACLASTTESFPNVVGEAMACGVPCVATDCGDVREVLGEAGRVVPVGDPARFAEAVLELLRLGRAAREAMGAAGRERIGTTFGMEAVMRRFREVQERAARGDAACGIPPIDPREITRQRVPGGSRPLGRGLAAPRDPR